MTFGQRHQTTDEYNKGYVNLVPLNGLDKHQLIDKIVAQTETDTDEGSMTQLI